MSHYVYVPGSGFDHVPVTGLDLSLTGSGVATVRHTAGGEPRIYGHLVKTDPFPRGYKPSIGEWVERQTYVVHNVIPLIPDDGLVVVETASFGSKFGNPFERAGVFWRVVQWLVRHGHPVATVAPKTRAKYATGKGGAGKPEVLAAVRQWAPTVRDHNVADATALAAMGSRWLGLPVDAVDASIERAKNEAVRVVRWPESMGVQG